MRPTKAAKRRRGEALRPAPRWLAPAAVGTVSAALLAISWRKWPDVLVDFGQQLYVPWQLSQGKVLYRDVAYLHGPLSQYLDSLVFRVFGASFLALSLFNIAIALGAAALIWALFRRAGGWLSATVASLLFVSLFAFGQYKIVGNYNFVSPYVTEVAHGVLLAIGTAYLMARHEPDRGAWWLVAAGFVLGVNFLTKAETFAASALSAAVTLGVLAYTGRLPWRRWAGLVGAFCAGAAAPPLVSVALFSTALPFREALDATLGPWRPMIFRSGVSGLPYFRTLMGTDDTVGNVLEMLRVAGVWCVLLVPAAFLARALGPGTRRLASAVTFVCTMVLLANVPVGWLAIARALPLAMVALAATAVVSLRDCRDDAEAAARARLRLSLATLGLGLLLKILLNARIEHYGFALAMPATLVLADALMDLVPRAIGERGGAPWVFRGAALAGMLLVVLVFLQISRARYGDKREAVGSGANLFYADGRGPFVAATLAELEKSMRPGETLAVLPEGAMVNFLSRRTNPTPYSNFMPPEVITFGEERMLSSLQAHPPDVVVVIQKDTIEFGLPLFGKDYGQRLYAWINATYTPVSLFGDRPLVDVKGFGIMVLRKSRG